MAWKINSPSFCPFTLLFIQKGTAFLFVMITDLNSMLSHFTHKHISMICMLVLVSNPVAVPVITINTSNNQKFSYYSLLGGCYFSYYHTGVLGFMVNNNDGLWFAILESPSPHIGLDICCCCNVTSLIDYIIMYKVLHLFVNSCCS